MNNGMLIMKCEISSDDTNCLYLKLSPSLSHPPIVHSHHVPIFICSKDDIDTCWDLTIQQVLANAVTIEGKKHSNT